LQSTPLLCEHFLHHRNDLTPLATARHNVSKSVASHQFGANEPIGLFDPMEEKRPMTAILSVQLIDERPGTTQFVEHGQIVAVL